MELYTGIFYWELSGAVSAVNIVLFACCLFTLNDLPLKTLSTMLLLQNAHAAFHKFF